MKTSFLICALCAAALAQDPAAPAAVEGVRGVRREGSGRVKEADPAAKNAAPPPRLPKASFKKKPASSANGWPAATPCR